MWERLSAFNDQVRVCRFQKCETENKAIVDSRIHLNPILNGIELVKMHNLSPSVDSDNKRDGTVIDSLSLTVVIYNTRCTVPAADIPEARCSTDEHPAKNAVC